MNKRIQKALADLTAHVDLEDPNIRSVHLHFHVHRHNPDVRCVAGITLYKRYEMYSDLFSKEDLRLALAPECPCQEQPTP